MRIIKQRQRETAPGQVLVIFALALVAIVAMVGLVIDGGATFVQRRDQQNVADQAAMAGAYAYVSASSNQGQAALAAARNIAAANGYTHDQSGVVVTVTVDTSGIAPTVQVDVSKPHQNYFAGVVGLPSWNVSTTATALTGAPNAAIGALPLIFNKKAFGPGVGLANARAYDEPGTGPTDVPQTSTTFNWTVFCTANGNPCNANSNTVDNLINGSGSSTTVTLNQLIGPLNAGAHTTLFSDLAKAVPGDYPVAIVGDNGAMVGWAIFHLTGSLGGSTKQISGYFLPGINAPPLQIVQGGGAGTTQYGGWSVKLVK